MALHCLPISEMGAVSRCLQSLPTTRRYDARADQAGRSVNKGGLP